MATKATLSAKPVLATHKPENKKKPTSRDSHKAKKIYDEKAQKTPGPSVGAGSVSFSLTKAGGKTPVVFTGSQKGKYEQFLDEERQKAAQILLKRDENLRDSQAEFPALRKAHVDISQAHILERAKLVKEKKVIWIIAPSVDLELGLCEPLVGMGFQKIYLLSIDPRVKEKIPKHLLDKVEWRYWDATGKGIADITAFFAKARDENWDKVKCFQECINFLKGYQYTLPTLPSKRPNFLTCSLVMTELHVGLRFLMMELFEQCYNFDFARITPLSFEGFELARIEQFQQFMALIPEFDKATESMYKRTQLQFVRMIGKGIPDLSPDLEATYLSDTVRSARYSFAENGETERVEPKQMTHYSLAALCKGLCDVEKALYWEYPVSLPNSSVGPTGLLFDVEGFILRPKKAQEQEKKA